jgi:predicted permease
MWLFPQPFRERFAAGMIEQIKQDLAQARARGRLAAVWCVVANAIDLIRSAAAERGSPTWTGPEGIPTEEQSMTWTMSEWARDLRQAGRALKRTPAFTALAVGMLGLAIGANAGMFGVVNTVLLTPLPYANPDRLVHIAASAPGSDMPPEFGVASEFYVQYKEQSRLLEDVSTYNSFTSTLRVDDRVERIRMSQPTNSMYSTLGARPILGRLPVAEDEDHVTVISYALWTSWFGRDSSVLGKSYYTSGEDRTIIGIMGPEFKFPIDGTLLWIASDIRLQDIETPGRFESDLVGRMAPGATPQTVADELNTLARRLPERFGGPPSYARLIEQHRAIVRPLVQQMLGPVSRPLWVLLGACGIVLLIACANVANLFMVRAEGRQRDLAVRRALGAARGQLVRLQMAEALIVAGLAGILALVLAAVTFPVFLRAAPQGIPRLADVHLDVPTLLFALAAAIGSALACGIVPALRGAAPDLGRLREGGRGSTRRHHWVRNGLVAAQTALALVLLIGSGLLVRSFWAMKHVDPGYDTKDLFTFQIAPNRPTLRTARAFADFDLAFMDRLRALPGVQSVGLVENVPLDEGTRGTRFRSEGTDADGGTLLNFTWTAGDYFSTMGISVLQGRAFEQSDHLTSLGNVIISRSAANLLWPDQNPIGRRLQADESRSWETVVGVVEDVMQNGFRDTPEPLVYFPLVGADSGSRPISSPAYVLKTARAELIAPEVRALAREVAPEAPMYRVYTMEELAKRSMVSLSFTMLTLGIASSLALILGAVGLYGVLSYVVAERTREIGVRMALGARAEQVRSMVVAQGARVVGVGVVIGIAVALAGMSASMVVVGLLASYLPARRASNVDPIESLRGD